MASRPISTHVLTTLADRFLTMKANLEPNETFAVRIQQRHNAVRNSVHTRNQKVVTTKLIGSVGPQDQNSTSRSRYVRHRHPCGNGIFLFMAAAGAPGGVSPQQALDDLHRTITASGALAVSGETDVRPLYWTVS